MSRLILIGSILLAPVRGNGQEREGTPLLGERMFAVGSRQEFNSYLWTANLALFQRLSNRWSVQFGENYRSSLLRLSSEGDRWKEDQTVDALVSYLLLPSLHLQMGANSIVFLDKQSGFNNDVRNSAALSGLIWTPLPQLDARMNAGPKWDARLGHRDRGLTYDVKFNLREWRWLDYDHRFELGLDEDRYRRRRNTNVATLYQIGREFVPGVADSFKVFATNRRRDNYISAQEEIESQREHVKGGSNVLYYRISPSVRFNLNSSLEFKHVELAQFGETAAQRRRKRNDQKIANDLGVEWRGRAWRGQFGLSYWRQTQQYELNAADSDRPFSSRIAFITPDNVGSRLLMTGLLRGRVGRDSLSAFVSVSKFRYDTPDTANFDDRDELRINTRAVWGHRFSPTLRTEWTAGVNLYHMVYIFGERSADNNWNRIIFLRPEIHYRPNDRLQFRQTFEVLANYVDYDFEATFVSARSFVFRKAAMTDSLQWQVMPRTLLLADYRLQFEENGQLSWSQWTERIVGTRTLQWLNIYWQYEGSSVFRSSAGYAVFTRREWKHSTDVFGNPRRDAAGDYLSHGPVLRLLYHSRSNLRLLIDAARYRVETDGQKSYFVNTIELAVRWLF